MRHAVALTLASLLAAAGASHAQITTPAVIASVDSSGGMPLYVFDIGTGLFDPTTIPFGQRVTGIAYNQAERRAYVLVRGTPPAANTTVSNLFYIDLNPIGSPIFVAATNGAANNNITSGGLAYDAANARLIGSAQGRIYAIDPATATLTLIRDFGNGNAINGMDVDPVSGSLFFTQNTATSATTIPTGRGVYRLDPPFDTSNPIKIATYPIKPAGTGAGAEETDLDGLAAAPGMLFLSTDETNALYRLNLSTLTYDSPIAQPYSPLTTVNVGGAAYVGSVTDGADVAISMRNDASAAVPPAGQYPFVVTIRNVGTQTATAATANLPLPVGTSFISATGGAMLSGSTVTLNAGDLAPGASASFNVTLASAAPFAAVASATTTAADVFNGNNSFAILSSAGAPDLIVSATAPANCSVTPGGDATFTVNVLNGGSRAVAGTLTIPIPAGATFVSSSPTGVSGGGIVTIDLGVLAAGAAVPVTASFTPGAGLTFGITATASSIGDANPADNTASASTVTANFANPKFSALLSTVTGAPNSTMTGLTTGVLGPPPAVQGTLDCVRSANGQWMTSHWRTNVDTFDDLIVRTNLVTGVSSVMGQEGATALPPDNFTPFFNTFVTPGVNNSGDFSFTGRFNDPNTATDIYAVKNIGGAFSLVAREGSPVPAIPGATYGSTLSGAGITNSGQTAFIASSLVGPVTAENQAFLANDGNTLICQKGITTPAGAAGPVTSINGTGCFVSADGTRYIYSGSTTAGGSKTVAVVGTVGGSDATVIVQTGTVLPGFTSAVSNFQTQLAFMAPEGRWFVRGSNADGEDWVISGTGNTVSASNVVLRTGTQAAPLQVIPSSTEVWDAGASTVNNITGFTTNPRGDTLAYGKTLGDTRSDLVFVFNGTTILAREGDPVDADNNGVFDDDAFIRQLDFDDKLVMNNDAVYAFVALRNRQGVCDNSSTTTNSALIKIPIPQPPANDNCCRGTTCNTVASGTCTGQVAGSNSLVVSSCGAGTALASCCFADFNHDGIQSIDDLFLYFNAYFTSSPYANFGGDGVATPTIDDLFLYINAYFSTCS